MEVKSSDFDYESYNEFNRLYENGNNLVASESFDAAIQSFKKAYSLIPEPKKEWEESTWVLTAIGETYFFTEDYKNALDPLLDAINCPEGLGNQLLHFRLGQVYYELGSLNDAAENLMRAYMGAGIDIFDDEDNKYLDFLKTKAKNII